MKLLGVLKRQRPLKRKLFPVSLFCVPKPQDIMHSFKVNRTIAIALSLYSKNSSWYQVFLVMETSWQNFKVLITVYTEKGHEQLVILPY